MRHAGADDQAEDTRSPSAALYSTNALGAQAVTTDMTVAGVAARSLGAVVTLRCLDARDQVSRIGSGFLARGGRVVTNAHVVRGCNRIEVHGADGDLLLTTPYADAYSNTVDVAVLPAVSPTPRTLALALNSPVLGQHIVVIGAPEGLSQTVSDGLISAFRPTANGRLLQFTAPVSHGSSGSPILNLQGQVVGIVVALIEEGQNLNFGIPASTVAAILNSPATQVSIIGIPLLAEDSAPEVAAESGGHGASVEPTHVNDSLSVDWRVLDGVQVRSEAKRDRGIRITTLVEYTVSPSPEGHPELARMTTETYWQTADYLSGRQAVTWYRDDTRTVLELEGTGREEFYAGRTPLNNQVPAAGSVRVIVDGGSVAVDSAHSHRTGSVPPGSLLNTLLGTVAASLPDSLPASVYVWFFDPLSALIRAEPVRIDFGNPGRLAIPLARSGTRCSPRGPDEAVQDTTVDVVEMTATVGADRLRWPVLARSPHVKLQDVKCLRLPDVDRWHYLR